MASAAVFEGLSTGFGLLGQSVLKDRERQMDEESDKRKIELRKKLDMDLMKSKYEFMKMNPSYKGHATNLSGDIIAFDEFGSPKVIYHAPPEEKAIRLGKANAELGVKAAQQAAYEASTDKDKAQTAFTEAKTADPQKFFKTTTPKASKAAKDPYALTSDALHQKITKRMPAAIAAYARPGTKAYDDAFAAAKKELTSEGYHVIAPGTPTEAAGSAPDYGVFGAAVPNQAEPDDDDEAGINDRDADSFLLN